MESSGLKKHRLARRTFAVAALAGAASLINACGGQQEATSTEDVKENYVAMAYAAYGDSLSTAEALMAAVNTFIASPNDANLLAARAAYKQARVPYQQSEIMRWDSSITLSKGLDLDGGPASVDDWEGQVNAWPLDENHIVGIIESDETIDIALLIAQNEADDNAANVTTGVHAVEFMLWGEDTNGTGPGAGMRSATEFANDGSCADDYCSRRADYLRAAATLLVNDLQAMRAEWSPEAAQTQGTLAHNFLNDEQAIDYIFGSMRAMASDELASARMSSGLELGDPEESHDCFSDLSHVAIFYNFEGVKNAFYGDYEGGVNVTGASVGDLVRERDIVTYVRIDDALQSIEALMQQIYDAGERETNTVRYDQIIGQSADGVERQVAEQAVDELIHIDGLFVEAIEALSLTELSTGGGGD